MQFTSNLDDRILWFLQKESSYILVYKNSQAKQHRLDNQWTYIWQPWLSPNGICLQKRVWGFYQPSSSSSWGVSAWTIYPNVNFQVDGGIKGWDLGLDSWKEGFVEVERKPPAELRLFVVQPFPRRHGIY